MTETPLDSFNERSLAQIEQRFPVLFVEREGEANNLKMYTDSLQTRSENGDDEAKLAVVIARKL